MKVACTMSSNSMVNHKTSVIIYPNSFWFFTSVKPHTFCIEKKFFFLVHTHKRNRRKFTTSCVNTCRSMRDVDICKLRFIKKGLENTWIFRIQVVVVVELQRAHSQ